MSIHADIDTMLTTEHRDGNDIIEAWSRLRSIEHHEAADELRAWGERVTFDPEAFQQQINQAMLDEGFILPSEIP